MFGPFSWHFCCKAARSMATLLIWKLQAMAIMVPTQFSTFSNPNWRSAPWTHWLVGSGEDKKSPNICFYQLYNQLRDGYCRTDDNDHGVHVVCATMTENFLAFTKSLGNDLSSRRGGFPGLKPGDGWCLCAVRWREAMSAGAAPLVNLRATHLKEILFC